MAIIELTTSIKAPIDVCFDLARSIDLHVDSTRVTRERAVGGVTTGLIAMGQTVTWEAFHLGFKHRLTSQITACKRPIYFRDEQIKGIFKMMAHDHYFESLDGVAEMRDRFEFESPCGWLGRSFDSLYLKSYLRRFLEQRNAEIKKVAESGAANKYLAPSVPIALP